MSQTDLTERLESLKSGVIGATTMGLTSLLLWLLAQGIPTLQTWLIWSQTTRGIPESALIHEAIALISGFLFGVTYRYIIRTDDNSHLKSGAIAAFGLVQGLAAAEPQIQLTSLVWTPAIPLVESWISFAIASLVLEWAIALNLLQMRK